MIKARGCKELMRWENGEKLTLKKMVLAKCADCMGKYADGKMDCEIRECALYPIMPYGVLWRGRAKKIMSLEDKKRRANWLKKGQKRRMS